MRKSLNGLGCTGLHSFGRFHKHDPKIVSKDDVKR